MTVITITDLKTEILKEHSKDNIFRVASLIGQDGDLFAKLMRLFFDDQNMDMARKAAWVMREATAAHPFLIKPYFRQIVRYLRNEKLHDAVKRNALGIFKDIQVDKKWRGPLIDICFHFLETKRESIAVKAFSMHIIAKAGHHEPEIMNELKLVVESLFPYETPGFRAQVRKIYEIGDLTVHDG